MISYFLFHGGWEGEGHDLTEEGKRERGKEEGGKSEGEQKGGKWEECKEGGGRVGLTGTLMRVMERREWKKEKTTNGMVSVTYTLRSSSLLSR